MNHKLESRLPEEISTTSDTHDTTLMAESEEKLKSLLIRVKGECPEGLHGKHGTLHADVPE